MMSVADYTIYKQEYNVVFYNNWDLYYLFHLRNTELLIHFRLGTTPWNTEVHLKKILLLIIFQYTTARVPYMLFIDYFFIHNSSPTIDALKACVRQRLWSKLGFYALFVSHYVER